MERDFPSLIIAYPPYELLISKLAFTCPNLTIEALEKGVKYVQN